jgi:hypothetical protein
MTKRLTTLLGLAALAACAKSAAPTRGGGDVSSTDACALLTPAEIQQALGVAVKPGVKQTTATSAQCQWDSQDEGAAAGVSVSVATYDDALFHTMSSASKAVPVSGLGEAAFTGYPHAGDVSIRQKGFEVDVGIADFKLASASADSIAVTLGKLVLSRL